MIQRLIGFSQGSQTDESKVASAVAPAKTAVEAIEAIAVGQPYPLGSELMIADFYGLFVFTYLCRIPEFRTITAQTPKPRAWWEQVQQLANLKKVFS